MYCRASRRLLASALATSAALAVSATLTASPAVATPQFASSRETVVLPERVVVDVVAANGAGCTGLTASVAADNSAIGLKYSGFTATTDRQGPSGATAARINCLIALRLHVPQGFGYMIEKITHRGRYHLESGATATMRSSEYPQGYPESTGNKHSLAGPAEGAWNVVYDDLTAIPEDPPSACEPWRDLNIRLDLRVNAAAGTAVSYVTLGAAAQHESSDGPDSTYQLRWKRCPA